jgi:peptidyl-prolyl cis-trans isomerase SurA
VRRGNQMRALALAALVIGSWAGGPAVAASPYDPIVTVNGAAVTGYDIEQRARLLGALGAEEDVRALAEQQLTEERVKVQAAERLGLELPEEAILAGLEEFAAARGLEVEGVLEILSSESIDRQTMDDFIEAGLVWRELTASRFRAMAQPTEEEVDAALARAANTPIEVYDLAEIALPFSERGQQQTLLVANQLADQLALGEDFAIAARQFSRSNTAANGGRLPPLRADTLPPALQDQVIGAAPGEVVGPVPIAGGVAIIKVVAIRNELPTPDASVTPEERREAMRRELFSERIATYGDGLLQELMTDAFIERP